ncbi:MAG TPA: Mu-like prophage major head subunit gpT family protein [Methylibium sp.]|nr:Mu-like prophage major head subunit gpT family protein [Methylibium sp.]
MDQAILSSRAVLGMYYAALENPTNAGWIAGVANLFNSDQASEQYPFLGQVPRMREWIGGRQAKGIAGNLLTIANKHYEATIEIALRDLRRDKTPQIQARMSEFAQEGDAHWGTLLSALIMAGTSTVCYDGQFFFDTDHSEGASGTQDNDITVDISAVPGAGSDNTPAFPNQAQMQAAIVKGIAQILSFKDDRGRPMNSNARRFLVTVPVGLYMPAVAALSAINLIALQQNINPIQAAGLQIDVQMMPELTWTDSFAVWRTDSPIKGLIRQNETDPVVKMKDENSEFAFDNDAIQIGVDAWRGADYGLWQRACYVTMV